MPDLKISQLPVASATTGAELFPVVQGGVTKQIALNAVRHIGSAVFDANGSMAVDTNTLFVDAANNRVGIGTASPSYALDVKGIFSLEATNSTNDWLIYTNTDDTLRFNYTGAGNDEIIAYSNGNLAVDTNTLFVDAANNRVGVGTATPGATFESVGTSNGATIELLRLNNAGSGANTQAQINFIAASASYGTITSGFGASAPQMTFNLPSVTAGNYVWQVTSADVMRLQSGNLGLGVTPSAWGIGKAIEVGATGNAIWGVQAADMRLLVNAYYDGTNYRYTNTATAGRYDCGAIHAWFTAPSGTAGNAISFTQRLQVDGTTTAGQTALMLWDVDNGTMERVTVGAADSGGTGFKVLRIPN